MPAFCYDYPRPAVAADIVILSLREGALQALLVRRGGDPFRGRWALPGGFLQEDEDLDACARRETEEETGVRPGRILQFANFSQPDRDPRGRVISVAYLALLRAEDVRLKAGTDAAEAAWRPLAGTQDLAFDHDAILEAALVRLSAEVRADPAFLFPLMPPAFTLARLQAGYEAALGRPVDKRNFRKLMEDSGRVRALEAFERGPHRPARLFTPLGA
ncbi:NUDIX hydrolase [Phenylobacterium parvum]|uniref:NUDIX hydrolase n=1 Tax=Phenylobacterium parvum TaxID=2201350 RepID=A0A2Z3HUE7_9CAUL|nr:NUDIX hydrolase [Phenylobacterium parvum]AWM78475.1 NUDIX hydrolase [Phenylobacterium parvum]